MNARAIFALCLSAALVAPPGWSQQVSGPKSTLQPESRGLKIVVIQGEGGTNNIRTKSAAPTVVEVRDSSDKPVPGAEVVFQLPAAGPGGVFYGWMRNQTAKTDDQGRAQSMGFAPNDEEGRYNMKVTATSGTSSTSVVIGQSNTRTGGPAGDHMKSSHKGLWIVLGVLAVGGIAGGVAATRGGNGTPAAVVVPVSVSAGAITVGGPR